MAGESQPRLEATGSRDGAAEFRVQGALDFDSVPELLRQSIQQFGTDKDLVLDLSGVTRANSAGLVLLIEWRRRARAPGRRVTIRNAPVSLRNLARVSELESVLSL